MNRQQLLPTLINNGDHSSKILDNWIPFDIFLGKTLYLFTEYVVINHLRISQFKKCQIKVCPSEFLIRQLHKLPRSSYSGKQFAAITICKDRKVFEITMCDYCVRTVKSKEAVILTKYQFKTRMKKGRTKKESSSTSHKVNQKRVYSSGSISKSSSIQTVRSTNLARTLKRQTGTSI